MLTYSFEDKGNDSLYEYLYKKIKSDILSLQLSPGEKLPSKRALAKHLNISTITVENAYNQLIAEGYLYSVPKSGFYVSDISGHTTPAPRTLLPRRESPEQRREYLADFSGNSTLPEAFPFSTWSKLMRETLSENTDKLMVRSPSGGVLALRNAIADYLYQFRGMIVEPSQIIIGAGTEYLYGLLIQLLGRDIIYATEDPGYRKISSIYAAGQVNCVPVPLDKHGVSVNYLEECGADILHISPSHHFPTGIVTPINRRYELLAWAKKNSRRYIIEDDYDSEFRMQGKPIPTMQSIDNTGKIIYINTFSKSLSSTIRISYMVLPKALLLKYNETLSFYACTVSNFEQYTLAKFIHRGYLEKHINRLRNHYRTQRDLLLSCIKKQPFFPRVKIREEHSGLHFLMEIETNLPDEVLIKKAEDCGIHISCLSQYYHDKSMAREHTLVLNYSALKKENLAHSVDLLFRCLFE